MATASPPVVRTSPPVLTIPPPYAPAFFVSQPPPPTPLAQLPCGDVSSPNSLPPPGSNPSRWLLYVLVRLISVNRISEVSPIGEKAAWLSTVKPLFVAQTGEREETVETLLSSYPEVVCNSSGLVCIPWVYGELMDVWGGGDQGVCFTIFNQMLEADLRLQNNETDGDSAISTASISTEATAQLTRQGSVRTQHVELQQHLAHTAGEGGFTSDESG
eukprot:GHVS01032621.1.p1 GENE.GHVS01032621.1~~GHVS01032621.1.p1  ORF type:complete len:216 (+),score=36.46 GHVS01032621.1:141-788(+)